MRKLTVIYDNGTGPSMLFDGEVEELVFTDSASGVRVEGRFTKSGAGQGAGLLDLLSKASKKPIEKRESVSD